MIKYAPVGLFGWKKRTAVTYQMPWPRNSSLLMLYGKRNLFLVDCTSDSWQMTLSLQVSGAETKLRTGLLPSLFEPARDAQMPAFTDAIAKNTENVTVENGVVFFVFLLPSWPVSTWKRKKKNRMRGRSFFMSVWAVHFFSHLWCSFWS